jgi:tRNA pseudouridine13 synthase
VIYVINSWDKEKEIGLEVYYTDTKGIGGKLRKSAEDFVVCEISEPPHPVEDGEYTIVKLRAKNWETNRLIRQLSRRLGISRRRIGFGGTKDRRAVTTQLFSIKAPLKDVENINLKDVEISEIYSSTRGLNLGDLAGNAFDIIIKDIQCLESETEQLVSETQKELGGLFGFPNFFGHQRFGTLRPITHVVGRKIIEGDFKGAVYAYLGNPTEFEGKESFDARSMIGDGVDYAEALKMFPKQLSFERAMLNHLVKNDDDFIGAITALPKNLTMMFVHAYQSYLFNRILSKRIQSQLSPAEPQIGDIVLPLDSKGLPDYKKGIDVSSDNIEKVTKKISQKKAYLSALVPGAEGRYASGVQGEIERKVVEEEGISPEDFIIPQIRELSSKGRRRAIVSPINNFEYEMVKGGIKMQFELPKGCYATSLLREFMKTDMLKY